MTCHWYIKITNTCKPITQLKIQELEYCHLLLLFHMCFSWTAPPPLNSMFMTPLCVCVYSFVTYKYISKQHIALFCLLFEHHKEGMHCMVFWEFFFPGRHFIWGRRSVSASHIWKQSNYIAPSWREKVRSFILVSCTSFGCGGILALLIKVLSEISSFWISVWGVSCPSGLAALLGTRFRCKGPRDVTSQSVGPCGERLWPLWNFSGAFESPLGIIFPFPFQIWARALEGVGELVWGECKYFHASGTLARRNSKPSEKSASPRVGLWLGPSNVATFSWEHFFPDSGRPHLKDYNLLSKDPKLTRGISVLSWPFTCLPSKFLLSGWWNLST